MRADRPALRTSTVPRFCSALTAAASGAVLLMAALAPARAQAPPANQAPQTPATDQADIFRPPDPATVFAPFRGDPRAPGRFRRPDTTRQTVGPLRFGEIPVY